MGLMKAVAARSAKLMAEAMDRRIVAMMDRMDRFTKLVPVLEPDDGVPGERQDVQDDDKSLLDPLPS